MALLLNIRGVLNKSWCSNENNALFAMLIDKFKLGCTQDSFVLLELHTWKQNTENLEYQCGLFIFIRCSVFSSKG